jgi:hypothetical protein
MMEGKKKGWGEKKKKKEVRKKCVDGLLNDAGN